MGEKDYLILLSTFSGFGVKRTKLLIDYFKTPKNVWNVKEDDLITVGVKKYIAARFIKHRNNFNADLYFEKLERLNIKCFSFKDLQYPKNLKDIADAPFLLYVLGNLRNDDVNSVAVVGSRRMSLYGKEMAELFAKYLSINKLTIISGLALGVDAVAQKAAIDVGGRSIAVIASGLDNITPYSNRWLAKKIIEKGGAIVSEAPLGAPVFKYSFPLRNRIISGIAKAVLVVEGAKKSGTLLTASHAAEQGKTVYAIPGEITSLLSDAPHFLIKNGATIATDPKDILDEMNIKVKVDKDTLFKIFPKSYDEKMVYKVLKTTPVNIDEIVRITNMEFNRVARVLIKLRLKGMVEDLGGLYTKSI